MMEISLDTNMFPQLRDGIRAQWAPVFFEPISGSYGEIRRGRGRLQ